MPENADERFRAAVEKPSSARVYDCFLGGRNNYAIDREFAAQQAKLVPDMKNAIRSNRQFIGRAVRFALGEGIRQFVDIGSGLPSLGQAHEVADREAPEAKARVVYVDNEAIAHAHSEILLDKEADPKRHKAVFGDFFDVSTLWREILKTEVINSGEPTCLLVTAILHFMPPETRPNDAMASYCRLLPSGSLLVLTHGSNEMDNERADQVAANYSKTTNPAYLRGREDFAQFFGDWSLVDPGLVWTVEWRPDGERPWWGDSPARSSYLAGVARKP